MRPIKILGLAATAAVAAMAFVGATSASAADTQLCNSHSTLTCGSAAANVSMTGSGTLLNDLASILCLSVSASASPLALGNPQAIHVTSLSFTWDSCGTNGAHSNCTPVTTELPLMNLNKTGLDAGTLTATNGRAFVACEDVDFVGTDIKCEYDLTDVEFTVGAQHLTADDTLIDAIGDEDNCPTNPALDGLLSTTANRYVLA